MIIPGIDSILLCSTPNLLNNLVQRQSLSGKKNMSTKERIKNVQSDKTSINFNLDAALTGSVMSS